jgi:hypothetical protein
MGRNATLQKRRKEMGQISGLETLTKNYLEYKNEFNRDLLPSRLAESRKRYSEFLQMLTDFYGFMSFLVDDNQIDHNEVSEPVITVYHKTALSLFAVNICLNYGLVGDSSIILRSIFENWLTTEIIFEDSWKDRAKLFGRYEHVEKYLQLKRDLELVGKELMESGKLEEIIPPRNQTKIEDEFQKVRSDYHPTKPHHWAWKIYKAKNKGKNPNISFLAKHFNELPSYNRLYSSASAYAHGSPVAKNIMQEEKSITLAPRHTDLIFNVGYLSLHFCVRIVNRIMPALIPEKSIEIVKFTENYEHIIIEYIKELKG